MPRRTAIAWVGGILSGIAIATVAAKSARLRVDHGTSFFIALNIAPIIVCTLVSVGVLRQWMNRHTALTRREFDGAAEQRRLFLKEITDRQAEVSRREEAVSRCARANEARIALAYQALVDERAAHTNLQAAHKELTEDYNRVVIDSLQQSANVFRPRLGAPPNGGGPCVPLPTRSLTRPSADAAHHHARDIADPLLS